MVMVSARKNVSVLFFRGIIKSTFSSNKIELQNFGLVYKEGISKSRLCVEGGALFLN